MRLQSDSLESRRSLVNLAHRYHSAGWLLGTCGNLSARVNRGEDSVVVITASGRDKGALTENDFVELSIAGDILATDPALRPSAETSIHLAIYRTCPDVNAVLHIHTVASTQTRPSGGVPGTIPFRDLEMLKGWGLWEGDASAQLPVFENHADVGRIADEVSSYLTPATEVPALIISAHGLTAWGASVADAHRHVEITEFLCRLANQR